MPPRRKRNNADPEGSKTISDQEIKAIIKTIDKQAENVLSSMEGRLKADLEQIESEMVLRLAKIPHSIQNMTIGELRKKGYFDPQPGSEPSGAVGGNDTTLGEEFQPTLNSTALRPDHRMPALGNSMNFPQSSRTGRGGRLNKFTPRAGPLPTPIITPKPLSSRPPKPGEILFSLEGSPVQFNFKVPKNYK